MTNNPSKINRNFKPLSIADSLRNVNKKFLYKFGKLDYIIHSKWSQIVGSFFVEHSEPLRISSIANSINNMGDTVYDKYLHVSVTPAVAVEFQHFQGKIIEKINSYFGYKAIKGIKIHQHFIKKDVFKTNKNKTPFVNQEERKLEIKKSTPTIKNKHLEESIVNLGLSIKNEEE